MFGGDRPSIHGDGVRIAVLDTGIDNQHPDLRDCIDEDAATSKLPLDSRMLDENGHGTHIAGIIAGSGRASGGTYSGISPDATIVPIRVHTAAGTGGEDFLIAGIEHAIEQGVDILNYSGGEAPWGKTGGAPPWVWPKRYNNLWRAFRVAEESGVLCVCAAGNSGDKGGSINNPGILPNVLTVGSLDLSGKLSEGSSRGPVYLSNRLRTNEVERHENGAYVTDEITVREKPDIVVVGGAFYSVPNAWVSQQLHVGGEIISCRPRNAAGIHPAAHLQNKGSLYGACAGTSQATAVASGLAALALEYSRTQELSLGDNPGKGLRRILEEAADPSHLEGHRNEVGRGELTWPAIRTVIDDCVANTVRRHAVLGSRSLRLIE